MNQEKLQANSSVHNINTKIVHHFHRPVASLSCFQKGTFYSGIKIFNSLPRNITSLRNEKTKFRMTLKKFICALLLLCGWIFRMCRLYVFLTYMTVVNVYFTLYIFIYLYVFMTCFTSYCPVTVSGIHGIYIVLYFIDCDKLTSAISVHGPTFVSPVNKTRYIP